MIGQRVGSYDVVRLLGEGGMGHVYEVRDAQTGERSALKVLRPEYASDKTMSARFLNG